GQWHRWLPERRRHLHGVHDAGLPRQVHAVHGARRLGQARGRPRALQLRASDRLLPEAQHQEQVRHRARMAASRSGADHRLPEALVAGQAPGPTRQPTLVTSYKEQLTAMATTTDQKVVVKEMSWDP